MEIPREELEKLNRTLLAFKDLEIVSAKRAFQAVKECSVEVAQAYAISAGLLRDLIDKYSK